MCSSDLVVYPDSDKPEKLAELYDVGTADDIAEHCAGGIAADENHSFSISGMGVPRGIGIFIPWNTDSW